MKRSPISNMVVIGVLLLGLILPVTAQTYNGQQLRGRVTYVPAGTVVDAVLTSPIDSSISRPGDLFNAKLNTPLYLGSDLVMPSGTALEGQIAAVEKGRHAGINGVVNMRLTAAVTPDGTRYPLSAVISANQTNKDIVDDKQGNVHGRSTKASIATGVARTAAWTAGGTILGLIFAPIVAGSIGVGAIAGCATGGGIGLASNLWRKGKDVKISSGTRIQFALDQPMSLASGIASAPLAYPR